MFPQIRRKDRALSEEAAKEILRRGTTGVLAVNTEEGFPYAVPVNYWFDGEHLYFHSAKAGYKLQCLSMDGNVSFCVVARDELLPEETSNDYASAIVFGTTSIVTDAAEVRRIMLEFCRRLIPTGMQEAEKELAAVPAGLCVVEITPLHITGKARAGAKTE